MSNIIVAPDTSTAPASQRPLVTRGLRRERFRIRHAAQRRRLLEAQKRELRLELLDRYHAFDECVFLDSIPGSEPFYNALVLGIVGDFTLYDDPRTLVKLAGSEVNHYALGDWRGTSRISHRGQHPPCCRLPAGTPPRRT